MATFSWSGSYYYPDEGGQYTFDSAAVADAAPPPNGDTSAVNSGNQITTGFLNSPIGDPSQLPGYTNTYNAAGGTASGGAGPTSQTDQLLKFEQQQQQQDALGIINQVLQEVGFTTVQQQQLSQWAWGEITNGASVAQVQVDLQNQPAFQARFPYIQAMRTAGLNVPSIGQILATESAYKSALLSFGITPPTDPNELTPLFQGSISPNEFNQRLQDFNDVTKVYGPFVRNQFEEFGLGHVASDSELYGELSGLHTNVSDAYSQNTGTPHSGGMSFSQIQNAIQYAQGIQKSYTQEGGSVQTGPRGQEQQTLEQRKVNLPSPIV